MLEIFDSKCDICLQFWGSVWSSCSWKCTVIKCREARRLKDFHQRTRLKCIPVLALTQNNYDVAIEFLKTHFLKLDDSKIISEQTFKHNL